MALFEMMHRPMGFTLIELIVAMTIATLALAVVPVSMMKLHDTAQYRTSIRETLSGLKLARSEAIRSGRSVAFELDVGERRFTVGSMRSVELGGHITLGLVAAAREIDGDRGIIRFYPDGSSSGGSVSIIRPSGDGVELKVDWLLGRVSQVRVPQS